MGIESKLEKLEKRLRKGKIEKAIKLVDKYAEDPKHLEYFAKVINKVRENIPDKDKHPKANIYLSEAAKNGNMENVIFGLINGADIEAQDKWGTALFRAVFNRNPRVAELLIHLGANFNYKDPSGQTIFMEAAKGQSVSLVRLLIRKGANPFARNNANKTAKKQAKLQEKEAPSFITREIIENIHAFERYIIKNVTSLEANPGGHLLEDNDYEDHPDLKPPEPPKETKDDDEVQQVELPPFPGIDNVKKAETSSAAPKPTPIQHPESYWKPPAKD